MWMWLSFWQRMSIDPAPDEPRTNGHQDAKASYRCWSCKEWRKCYRVEVKGEVKWTCHECMRKWVEAALLI